MKSITLGFLSTRLFLALLLIGGCSGEKLVESEDYFRVGEVMPIAAARQVDLDLLISVTFNQQLDSQATDSNTVVLNDSLKGTISISHNVLTFTPTLPLDSNTVYEARVSKDITDIHGNTLARDYRWSFTTVDGAGYNWIESEDSASHSMYDVVWKRGQFIMVGGTRGISSKGAILSSVDGINWVSRAGGNFNALNAIDYFNSKYLAVGAGGTILSSRTGEQWVKVSTNTNSPLFDIASSSSTCVAVGMGMVLVSNDGFDWDEISVPYTGRLISVCWTGDRFIATTQGDSMSYFLVSQTGEHWEKIALEWYGQSRTEFYSIGASDDLIVAVGPWGNVFTSVDGVSWEQRDIGIPWYESVFLESVIWDGQRFVVAGGSHAAWGGFTAISRDGINWEQQNYVMHNGGEFTSIAWSGTRYVVSSYGMGGGIFYSP